MVGTIAVQFNEVLKGHIKTLTNGETWALLQICLSVYKPVSHKKPNTFPALFLEDASQVMHYL